MSKPWERKNRITLRLTETETEEGPRNLKELSKILDQALEGYSQWVVEEKKDSPLIPYEVFAIRTFLIRQYMLS